MRVHAEEGHPEGQRESVRRRIVRRREPYSHPAMAQQLHAPREVSHRAVYWPIPVICSSSRRERGIVLHSFMALATLERIPARTCHRPSGSMKGRKSSNFARDMDDQEGKCLRNASYICDTESARVRWSRISATTISYGVRSVSRQGKCRKLVEAQVNNCAERWDATGDRGRYSHGRWVTSHPVCVSIDTLLARVSKSI